MPSHPTMARSSRASCSDPSKRLHASSSPNLSSSPPSSSSENDQEALETVELLSTLLLFTHFLLLLLFGPPYLPLATALVLPPRYQQTSAPRILRAFRFYLPAMAYNGVLEAFLASVCTPADPEPHDGRHPSAALIRCNLDRLLYSFCRLPAPYSPLDCACFVTLYTQGKQSSPTVYLWETFGSTAGFALDLPNPPLQGAVLTSLVGTASPHCRRSMHNPR
ncbi:hypothetical protein EDB84DRAFT_400445 [Lactarius hengduanensis]|nr:hypothetical protein EDB84DRAFT_400445 [Lactarius hengduanensis]